MSLDDIACFAVAGIAVYLEVQRPCSLVNSSSSSANASAARFANQLIVVQLNHGN